MVGFARRLSLPVPVAELFAWHRRPGAFERLAPSWEQLEVVERRGTIETGDRLHFRVRKGPVAVDWIARRSWCNGKVVTWGPSAMGITQNLLAPDAPAALKAQMIAMAPSDLFSHAAYQGGVLREEAVDGWLAEMPFSEVNKQAVLAHPTYDAFWTRRNSLPLADRVGAPALFIAGWHDAFLEGTIDSFVAVHNQGGPGARGKCRLVIGPWNHDDLPWIMDPRNADCLPSAASPVPFFLRQLRGSPGLSKPVWYYVMGGGRSSTGRGGSRPTTSAPS